MPSLARLQPSISVADGRNWKTMRPCSSEWTRCSSPGLCAYGPSSAATGLCRPEVGGFVRYFTLEVVCPRPSFRKLRATQPEACVALAKSVTRCVGMGAFGKSAFGVGRHVLLVL